MEIKLYNTLTQKLEIFSPIKKGRVSMYHCGPTVYSKPHIGNYRPYIFADVLRRLFEANDYRVKQVINITDVGHLVSDADDGEDKVEKEAKKTGLRAKEITEEITKIYFDDLKKLNVEIKKIKFPRATKYIKEQIKLIQKLEKKGYTYKTSDGIYFDTSLFKEYGALGHVNLENLQEGARVEMNDEKKNKTDFALWKFSNPNETREQEWKSPWGIGFPGWHIECSAMSYEILGQPFDIHTGGVDHINTHHNNEIAQSKCANDLDLAHYWMHVNHIMIDSQKISKSLGHALYLSDFEKENVLNESYRYWTLSGQYNYLLNFKMETLKASDTALRKIISQFKNINVGKVQKELVQRFVEILNDNVDTPKAIAYMWEILKDEKISQSDKKATIFEFDNVLGFNLKKLVRDAENIKIPKQIIELGNERKIARDNKDFSKSDQIRAQINDLGYIIKDIDDTFEILPK